MPETKGRSLVEIESYYANGRKWEDEESRKKIEGSAAEKVDQAKSKAEVRRQSSEQRTKC